MEKADCQFQLQEAIEVALAVGCYDAARQFGMCFMRMSYTILRAKR